MCECGPIDTRSQVCNAGLGVCIVTHTHARTYRYTRQIHTRTHRPVLIGRQCNYAGFTACYTPSLES